MIVVLLAVGFAVYYGLFKAGKFVKDHPGQSLRVAATVAKALRK